MVWLELSGRSLIVGAVDVFVVSFLVYRILLLVRGTRAQPMLAGFGVLFLVYALSRELDLVVLNWVLGNFLGSVILVIVVLFQEDLRRALVKVGLGPGLGSSVHAEMEQSIAEVAKAAAELSSRRLGALIVIGRDVGLDEYIEGATPIDAVVSHQLLISVFLSTSPIHDGAVVILGNRVVVAGAVLPLTFSNTLSQDLGTRHRAAVGLTERNDALVVVVSEETGIISLVREGKFTRDLSEKTLFNALHRMIVVRHQKRRRRQKLAMWWRKVFKSSTGEVAVAEEESETDASAQV